MSYQQEDQIYDLKAQIDKLRAENAELREVREEFDQFRSKWEKDCTDLRGEVLSENRELRNLVVDSWLASRKPYSNWNDFVEQHPILKEQP